MSFLSSRFSVGVQFLPSFFGVFAIFVLLHSWFLLLAIGAK
jgi:hypothetical protein